MPEDKRPLKVFLCHAHIIPLWDADHDVVKALYACLTNDSVGKGELLPGQDWKFVSPTFFFEEVVYEK